MGLRRKRVTETKRRQIIELLDKGWPVKKVAETTAVSESEVYKIRSEVRKAQAQREEQAAGEPAALEKHRRMEILYDRANPQYRSLHQDQRGRRGFYVLIAASTEGQVARSAWAKLTILSLGDTLAHKVREFGLHPKGDEEPYSTPRVSAKWVDIVPGIPQYFDVALSAVGPCEEHALTSGRVFSLTGLHEPEGCWVATPIVLLRPAVDHQAYLPPGRYEVRVTVGDENGPASSADFTLISPARGQELDLQRA